MIIIPRRRMDLNHVDGEIIDLDDDDEEGGGGGDFGRADKLRLF